MAAWAECTCAGAARLATSLFLSQSSLRFALASLCVSHARRAQEYNDTGARGPGAALSLDFVVRVAARITPVSLQPWNIIQV